MAEEEREKNFTGARSRMGNMARSVAEHLLLISSGISNMK